MKLPYFEYRAPATLREALQALAALGSDARILAGGQTLLPIMRYRLSQPNVLLDLGKVAELRAGNAPVSARIAPMTTHAQLAHNADPTPYGRLLAAHGRQIAYPAVRTRGTVGGSLVQADPAGDWPLLFQALGARVELQSLRGTRTAALADFITGPMQADLAIDEILTCVHVDANAVGLTRWGRAKLMLRAGEYAASSAVALQRADGRWSCWIGAIEAGPAAMARCAALLDAQAAPSADTLLACAREDVAQASPESGRAEAHRHAVNLTRAIQQALNHA